MIYAFLADGRDQAQLRELDLMLAGTDEEKERIQAKANMEAMKQLQAGMAGMQAGPRSR